MLKGFIFSLMSLLHEKIKLKNIIYNTSQFQPLLYTLIPEITTITSKTVIKGKHININGKNNNQLNNTVAIHINGYTYGKSIASVQATNLGFTRPYISLTNNYIIQPNDANGTIFYHTLPINLYIILPRTPPSKQGIQHITVIRDKNAGILNIQSLTPNGIMYKKNDKQLLKSVTRITSESEKTCTITLVRFPVNPTVWFTQGTTSGFI